MRPLVELTALCGLLVAQPLYADFTSAGAADLFVYRRASTLDVIVFTVAIAAAPPLALFAVERLVRFAARSRGTAAQTVVHLAFVGLLVGLLAVHLTSVQALPDPVTAEVGAAADTVAPPPAATPTWLLGLAAAGAAAVAMSLWLLVDGFRRWCQLVAIAVPLFAGLFLFTDPMRSIAFAEGSGDAVNLSLEERPDIVFVIFDELPTASLLDNNGHVDAQLYPNFAALEATSTWFRNTTTVSPSSPTAVPAILTANKPAHAKVLPTVHEHPRNLFTLLASNYDVHALESVADLCPDDVCPETEVVAEAGGGLLLADAVDVFVERLVADPPESEEAFKIRQSQPNAPNVWREWVAAIEPSDEPRLDFAHLVFPHQPWFHLPSGHSHGATSGPLSAGGAPFLAEGLSGSTYNWSTDFTAAAARQRHVLQLLLADRLLGDVLQRLRDLGTFDESMIVVTADHGVAFRQGEPIRGISQGNAAEVMWVPWFVKLPGQTTARLDERPARTLDILPTLVDDLGAELPWRTDGASMHGPRPPDADDREMLEWAFNAITPMPGAHYVTLDGANGYRQLLDDTPRVRAQGGEPALAPYRFGRWGHLVDRPVRELRIGAPSKLTATLRDAERYSSVDTSLAVLPVYVAGEVATDTSPDLVVAVDGVVGGWSETLPTKRKGQRKWFVLVPEHLLHTDGSVIELYQAFGDLDAPGKVLLRPVPITGPAPLK